MRYLCLIYQDESLGESRSQQEAEALHVEYWHFTNAIKESGHYVGGNALQPTSTATTVRVREGKLSATDGPFAEAREQLGGYYLIEAVDLDEAIRVAARIPGARLGSIEIRPVLEVMAAQPA